MHMQSSTAFNVCFCFFSPPHARFQHEKAKLFGNLLPGGAFMQGSHIELSSARMFDAASVVEHMPHSVLVRLFAHKVFFSPLSQSCCSGRGEEGPVRDSSCPLVWKHYDMYDLDENAPRQHKHTTNKLL